MHTTIKKFLIGLFLLALVLPLLAAGVLWGLAGTPAGTRWVAGQVIRVSGDTLSWRQLEGTLLDSLQLRGLRLRLPGIALDMEALELAWQPRLILAGTVQLDRVTGDGIRIVLTDSGAGDAPGEPFNPADLDLPIAIALKALELRDIELRMGENPPRRIDTITLAAGLQDHQLALQQFQIHAPEGELAAGGSVELTAAMPLELELQWDLSLPDQQRVSGELQAGGELDNYTIASQGQFAAPGLDASAWSLTARGTLAGIQLEPLTVTSGPYELALSGAVSWNGPISADLEYRARAEQLAALNPQLPPQLDALGSLVARFEDETLRLEQLVLALEQAPLRVEARGSVRLPPAGEPILDGELQWHALQWPLSALATEAEVSSPEGRISLTGTPESWNLGLAMRVAGSQLPPGDWQARGEGDRSELRLEHLQGKLLDGNVSLSGLLAWDPVLRWNLQAGGRDLNPGEWQPDIPGRLAFDLHSEGQMDAEQGPQATFALRQLAGELAGRPFSLAGNGALAGDTVQLEGLALESGANRISASGRLGGESLALDWALQVPQPGLLLPGAAGSLEASGRLEGTAQSPRLQARLVGQELRLDELSLPRLAASLQAGLAARDKLQLEVDLGPVQQGEQVLLDSARLAATGTTASHQLELELQGPSEQFRGRLEGGLDAARSTWRGSLAAMSIDSAGLGHWQLAQAASLEAAPGQLALGDTCLLGDALRQAGEPEMAPARVCAGGEWSSANGGHLDLGVQTFALARLLPGLGGELSGEMNAALAPAGALTGRGRFAVSPGAMRIETSQGVQHLAHGGGQVDVAIGSGGLVATLDFKPLQDGQVQAELTLPQLHSVPLADNQPLAGRIQAELPDLSGLQGWVPQLEAVSGRLDADLRLGGELRQPGLEGELNLTGGAADIPVAGLQLREIQLRLRDDPGQPGQMLLTGGLLSGKGRLALNGRLSPSGETLALALTGDAVEVFDTPDAQVLVSPDLALEWGDELLRLRGDVLVPRARITPKLGLSPGLAAPQESPGTSPEVISAAAPEAGNIIAPSADVVVLGAEGELVAPAGPSLPFRLDSQVQLVLGKKVQVNALGFAGRIAGKVTFSNLPGQAGVIPVADGLLSVEDGSFRSFGQDLEIETGQIIFRKVPVTEPEINLRAVRWIDNDPLVSAAGIQLSGPASAPVMELFSQPQLDPTEIQSYLLTGQSAAGEESVLSIGTYLYTTLYVGYGYNLLEQTSEFNSLYIITPRYGVDSSFGEADNSIGLTITYER